MLDSTSLKAILKEIFGVDDKYLVPISTNWFLPTTDPEDTIGTWIGYRIQSKRPMIRTYQPDTAKVKPIKVSFRLSFVGPQAEALADATLMWDDRKDVKEAFEAYQAQLNYTDRTSFTYPIRNGGFNDELCWIVDMTAQTFFEIDTKQKPWIYQGN